MKTLLIIALCLTYVLVGVTSVGIPIDANTGGCSSGYYQDAGLCYPNCRDGYYNVGSGIWKKKYEYVQRFTI